MSDVFFKPYFADGSQSDFLQLRKGLEPTTVIQSRFGFLSLLVRLSEYNDEKFFQSKSTKNFYLKNMFGNIKCTLLNNVETLFP